MLIYGLNNNLYFEYKSPEHSIHIISLSLISSSLISNLYSKTKLGEDALVNLSVEKGKDKKILGTCVLRSKTKDFMTSLGEKIKALIS